MSKVKTKDNEASVAKFLDSIPDDGQRSDARVLLELMQKATKTEPKMWGGSIVGFGTYHYVDKSGREGDWCLAGFSPRKGTLTLFMLGGWEQDAKLLAKLGKHSLRQEILYIKRLDDVNGPALKRLISTALKAPRKLRKPKRRNRLRPKADGPPGRLAGTAVLETVQNLQNRSAPAREAQH
jgi:hypothetical protein